MHFSPSSDTKVSAIPLSNCDVVLLSLSSLLLDVHLFDGYGEMEMGEKGEIGEIRLVRESKDYWRVTFDIPPLNIFGRLSFAV